MAAALASVVPVSSKFTRGKMPPVLETAAEYAPSPCDNKLRNCKTALSCTSGMGVSVISCTSLGIVSCTAISMSSGAFKIIDSGVKLCSLKRHGQTQSFTSNGEIGDSSILTRADANCMHLSCRATFSTLTSLSRSFAALVIAAHKSAFSSSSDRDCPIQSNVSQVNTIVGN